MLCPARRLVLLATLATSLASGTACVRKIDRYTIDRVVDEGMDVADTGKVCALGSSLAHPLASVGRKDPHRALLIAELTSALCAEEAAWEGDLEVARSRTLLAELPQARAAAVTDARLKAGRAHARAATRFERAFTQLEALYGPIGEGDCPRIKADDEVVYLLGLVSGTLALVHDKKGGNTVGVPLDRLPAVARGSTCLDDETWWYAPQAVRAGAWATIPGSAPEGVDPWQLLEDAAEKGSPTGVRVARAMQVLIAANAGETGRVEAGLRAHAASLEAAPADGDWALLDEYARLVSLQESDLLWTESAGHRTETFGELPSDEEEALAVPDLFADDPFATPPAEAPSGETASDVRDESTEETP